MYGSVFVAHENNDSSDAHLETDLCSDTMKIEYDKHFPVDCTSCCRACN